MLDLKDIGREGEAVALCRRHLPLDRFVVSTLEDVSVATIRRDAPEVEVGLSLEHPGGPELIDRARACDGHGGGGLAAGGRSCDRNVGNVASSGGRVASQ